MSIPSADDPNALINGLAETLFNYPITPSQVTSLKDILIPGLPDYEWSVEYSSYLANPGDAALATSVKNKLVSLMSVMVRMAEFQVM
jgi:hypothetical protein